MRAIFWKTTRELLPWAVLGMTALTIVLGIVLAEWYDSSLDRTPIYLDPPLLSEDVLATFYLATAVLGVWLGISAGRRARGMEWGLLIHRPLGRTRIFAGMSLAMVCVYLLAMGLPLAGAIEVVHWIAPRGPFAWGMALPAVMAVTAGVPLLFGGMLIMLRRARWYGSMCLPAVFMLAVAGYAIASAAFWLGAVWALAGTVVLGVAAWGVFVSGADERKEPAVVRAAQGITLSVGLVFGEIMAGVLLAILAQYVTGYPVMGAGAISFVGDSPPYRLTRNGQLVIEHVEWGKPSTWKSPQGQPLVLEDKTRTMDSTQPVASLDADDVLARDDYVWLSLDGNRGDGYRDERTNVHWFPQSDRVAVWWVYEAAAGRVVGYHWPSWVRAGNIGPEGFARDDVGATDRLTGRLLITSSVRQAERWLCLSNGIYQLDADRRELRQVYEPESGREIIHVEEGAALPRHLVVLTDQTLELVSKTGKYGRVTLPLPAERSAYAGAGVAMIDGGRRVAVYYARSACRPAYLEDGCVLIYDTADERLVQRFDLPKQSRGVPMVAGFSVFEPWFGISLLTWAVTWGECAFEPASIVWQLVILGVLAVFWELTTMIVAWRWMLGGRRVALWGVLGLLMGLAGLLLLLCMVRRPVKVRCPSCGQRRVVTRDACERCGAAFPAPVVNGTEVFA